MSDDTYDLDLGKVRRALDGLGGVEDQVMALKGDYLADYERYKGWNGDKDASDDYYTKTQPDDEKTVRTLTGAIESLGLAVTALRSGLLESLNSVKAVHADVTELIEQQGRIADFDSGDDNQSGGKH
ncbi:hypothetical protein [Streptomyces sp. NPDC097640]|uniref:hypothetical protein n=1 Tax=Streptomyces sp. NPDC097640 TaxID=3157229 RepID=UPI003332D881